MGERTEAVAAVGHARAIYAALGPAHADRVAELDAWIATVQSL